MTRQASARVDSVFTRLRRCCQPPAEWWRNNVRLSEPTHGLATLRATQSCRPAGRGRRDVDFFHARKQGVSGRTRANESLCHAAEVDLRAADAASTLLRMRKTALRTSTGECSWVKKTRTMKCLRDFWQNANSKFRGRLVIDLVQTKACFHSHTRSSIAATRPRGLEVEAISKAMFKGKCVVGARPSTSSSSLDTLGCSEATPSEQA